MKLSGYCCDRCGRHYEKNETRDPENRTTARICGVGLTAIDRTLYRSDLCDDCLKELIGWLYGNDDAVTEDEESDKN